MQMKHDLQIWRDTIKKCQIIDMENVQYFKLMSKNIVLITVLLMRSSKQLKNSNSVPYYKLALPKYDTNMIRSVELQPGQP